MSPEGSARSLFTLPNLVTLSRIPMAALVWIRPLDPFYVLALMALAGVSDVLDGWLERRRRRTHPPSGESVGTWLDPLCDKIFILSLLTAITVTRGLSPWIIPLIALREILQTVIVLGSRATASMRSRLRPRFRANVLGKITTLAQFATVAALLFGHRLLLPLAIVTAALGLAAVAVYVRRALAA